MESIFDEQLVERYVRHRERLSEAERATAEVLLARNPAARAIAAELQAFYEAFEAISEAPSPADEAFLDRLFPPARIIPLHAYQPRRAASGRTILAAMTEEKPGRFETLARFASEEEQILVRLLYDRTAQQGRLYTFSAEEGKRAHALVSFPELATYFVTDEHGRVECPLTATQAAADWQGAHVELHRPLAETTVPAADLKTGPYLARYGPGLAVRCQLKDEHFHIAVVAAVETAPAFAVVVAGDERLLTPITERQGQVRLPSLPPRVTLRLYP